MVADLKMVIQLQQLDGQIGKLQREVAALPKHINSIEKTLEAHVRRLEADRAAAAANQRERKTVEAGIQEQEGKISKLKDQMLQAKTNDQYAAFRNEIEYCENEIHKCEDRILECMSAAEPLDQNVKKAEVVLTQEKQHVEAEKGVARERTAENKHRLDELKKRRAEIIKTISPSLYSTYERIRKTRKGVAVTEAVEGSCNSCHMTMRPQFYQDLRRDDSVMFCESCGRIIYYTRPPAEVDELGPDGQPEPRTVESNL